MAPLMDGAGEELLAGAAFAKQEDAGIGACRPLRGFDDRADGRAGADDVGIAAVDFRAQVGDLPLERVTLKGFADDDEEMIFVERLGEEVVGAFFHGLDGGVHRSVRSHDDDGQIFDVFDLSEPLEDLNAGQFREVEIEKDQVGGFLLDLVQRLLSVPGDDRRIARGLQPILQHCDDIRIVVDNEEFSFHNPREW